MFERAYKLQRESGTLLTRKPFRWLKAISEGKFFFFLVFLLIFIGFSPLLLRLLPFRLAYDISFTAVLLAGVYAASDRPGQSLFAAALAVPMLIILWWGDAGLKPVGSAIGVVFIGFTIALMVKAVLTAKKVTNHVVWATVSAYLLMGIMWGFVYHVLYAFQPEAFSADMSRGYTHLYFSFVTLTTLGYGDIVPVSVDARAITVLEAVIGQLYLAVIVARLVGIYISQEMMKSKDE